MVNSTIFFKKIYTVVNSTIQLTLQKFYGKTKIVKYPTSLNNIYNVNM